MQKRQQQSLKSFFSPKNGSKTVQKNDSPAAPSSNKKRYPLVTCSDKEGNIIVSELKPTEKKDDHVESQQKLKENEDGKGHQ